MTKPDLTLLHLSAIFLCAGVMFLGTNAACGVSLPWVPALIASFACSGTYVALNLMERVLHTGRLRSGRRR